MRSTLQGKAMSIARDIVTEVHNYNIDVKNREIYLNEFDDAGERAGVDHRMLQNFIKNINILKNINKEPITIHMQTVGGCWYSGMGIYDAIKNSKCKTTFIAYGQLCSMGTIIIQAASKRLMTPNSMFMCHYGSTDLSGDFLSSQNYSTLDKINCETMVSIYSEKCSKYGEYFKERGYNISKTKSFIKRKMKDGDWYMTPEQAIQYGFIDGIYK
jgi:ATP-dependent protease ClpP protease subunit